VDFVPPKKAGFTCNLKEKLGYSGGKRTWLPASSGTPSETVANLDGSNIGNNLSHLGALTSGQHGRGIHLPAPLWFRLHAVRPGAARRFGP
jgi:hypothetical protein